jgi:hypothetical protein
MTLHPLKEGLSFSIELEVPLLDALPFPYARIAGLFPSRWIRTTIAKAATHRREALSHGLADSKGLNHAVPKHIDTRLALSASAANIMAVNPYSKRRSIFRALSLRKYAKSATRDAKPWDKAAIDWLARAVKRILYWFIRASFAIGFPDRRLSNALSWSSHSRSSTFIDSLRVRQ